MHNLNIYAHRGGRMPATPGYIYPPNTLKNFQASSDCGVDGIETDICFTKDKEPIIYHPGTFSPDPQKMLFSELAGYQKHRHIPHLDGLLSFLEKSPELECMLEIKEQSPERARELITLVVDKISRSYDLIDRVYLTAPDRKIGFADLNLDGSLLLYAKRLNPAIKTHVIDTFPSDLAGTAERFKADMISYGWVDLWLSRASYTGLYEWRMGKKVLAANQKGIKVIAGIANTREEIFDLLDFSSRYGGRLSGIVTDEPLLAESLLVEILEYIDRRSRK